MPPVQFSVQLAEIVRDEPEQTITGDVTVKVGGGITVTGTVVVPEHPTPKEPVIVYVVFTVGLAVTVAPVLVFNDDTGIHV